MRQARVAAVVVAQQAAARVWAGAIAPKREFQKEQMSLMETRDIAELTALVKAPAGQHPSPLTLPDPTR